MFVEIYVSTELLNPCISTHTIHTHIQYMWKESAVSLSSCVQRRRVLQLIGLISEVEKTPKHPFISCFFFLPATQPTSRFLHFHMSHPGPRPGTNELTDPQLIPHCLFVCSCVCVWERENMCTSGCLLFLLHVCLHVSVFASFLSFQAAAVVTIYGYLISCNGTEHRVYLHNNANTIFNANLSP